MQWDKKQEEVPGVEQGEELQMTSPGTCAFDHRCSDARTQLKTHFSPKLQLSSSSNSNSLSMPMPMPIPNPICICIASTLSRVQAA
ncbi:GD20213 [Drosophila simulans]|uniref:GD20213 n=1 Tax=Drosophila simulans TaxID=7240 RepID=B4QV42_DROSI|nr:GD20213 [Drosophila simulans]